MCIQKVLAELFRMVADIRSLLKSVLGLYLTYYFMRAQFHIELVKYISLCVHYNRKKNMVYIRFGWTISDSLYMACNSHPSDSSHIPIQYITHLIQSMHSWHSSCVPIAPILLQLYNDNLETTTCTSVVYTHCDNRITEELSMVVMQNTSTINQSHFNALNIRL